MLGHEKSVFDSGWPAYDASLLVTETIELVVQVGGKTRGKVVVSKSVTQDEALAADQLPDDVYSWALRVELSPVALFLVSIPVAFVAPWLAVVVWFLSVPFQAFWNRRRPGTVSRYLS